MLNEEQLALLRKLVSINSVFPKEEKIARFVRGELESHGFEASLQEFSNGRFNVVAQKGPRKGSVLLFGHLDTVPPYNYGARNPFKLIEKGNKLRGLGAWDMKAGIAIILACARGCRPGAKGLRIVLTGDEENISEGTWFAQKRGEYRNCSVAITTEIPDIPDSNGLGRPPILLGRRGRCVYKLTVSGIGSHGAGTGGVSAIDLGMKLAQALEKIPMPSGKMGPCRLFIRKFYSESSALAVPTAAVLEADVHYVPTHSPESFLKYLKNKLGHLKFPKGCSWKIEIPKRKTPYLPAYETGRNDPLVKEFLLLYKRHLGAPEVSFGLTVADENVLSVEGIPILTLGPIGDGAHSSGEWVLKKDFLRLSEKFPKIVQGMLDNGN